MRSPSVPGPNAALTSWILLSSASNGSMRCSRPGSMTVSVGAWMTTSIVGPNPAARTCL